MRENRPLPPGGSTVSPISSARRRSSSSCVAVSFVGTCTTSSARRSPRPRPRTVGTPRPRRVKTLPDCEPAGMRSSSSPSRVGRVMRRPERGLDDRHRDRGHEVVADPRVALVRAHRHVHVQVAGRTPARADRAPPGQAQRGPAVDPAGDVDLVDAVLDQPAVAGARLARGDDHLAEPAAARAGRGRHHLAEHALADPPDLAGAGALGARDRAGAGRRPVAVARRAAHRGPDGDRKGGAEDGLLEGQVGLDLQVLAAWRTDRSGRPAAEGAGAAEERVEQVAEPAGPGAAEEVPCRGRRRTGRPRRSGRRGPAAPGRTGPRGRATAP